MHDAATNLKEGTANLFAHTEQARSQCQSSLASMKSRVESLQKAALGLQERYMATSQSRNEIGAWRYNQASLQQVCGEGNVEDFEISDKVSRESFCLPATSNTFNS